MKEIIEAMKEIKQFCAETPCTECPLFKNCDEGNLQPYMWELEREERC